MKSSNEIYKVLVEINHQHYTADMGLDKSANIVGTDWMIQIDTMLVEPTYNQSGIAMVNVWYRGHQPRCQVAKVTKNITVPISAANNPITYTNYTKRLGRRYRTPMSGLPDASMVPDSYFRWTWCCILLEREAYKKQIKQLEKLGWGHVKRLASDFFRGTEVRAKKPYDEVYVVERYWGTRRGCFLDADNINEALSIIKSNSKRNQNPEGVIICDKQFGLSYKGWSKYGHFLFNTLTKEQTV